MANTFELIASSTVGSGGAASIDFTSIPSTFTDLCLKLSTRSSVDAADILVLFNGSSSNFTWRLLGGSGSAAFSNSGSASYGLLSNRSAQTANTFSSSELYVPNYAGSTNKSASADSVNENNATAATQYLGALLWSQTAAINAISIAVSGSNFVQYSTAYLYGVKNA